MLGVILALFVFGVGKAAVMPFHRWLPAAMVAPTPVSALLHAVAVVKAGVFTILKVAVYVFGLDLLSTLPSTPWLAWVAAATIILASLVAFTKDNLKARLAYSTVSQLSYIVLGALLANRMGIIGGGMHIAMHAFGKITLFFAAGAVLVAAHETDISRMRGLGRTMPVTFGAFFLGSLSIIGLPPAGGAWSKWFLGMGTLEAGQIGLLATLMLSSLLSLGYLLEVPVRAFFSKPPRTPTPHGHPRGALCLGLAIVVTATATLALFFYPGPGLRPHEPGGRTMSHDVRHPTRRTAPSPKRPRWVPAPIGSTEKSPSTSGTGRRTSISCSGSSTASAAVLAVADLFVHRHAEHPWEHLVAFYPALRLRGHRGAGAPRQGPAQGRDASGGLLRCPVAPACRSPIFFVGAVLVAALTRGTAAQGAPGAVPALGAPVRADAGPAGHPP